MTSYKQPDRRSVRQQQMKKEPVEIDTGNDVSQMSNTTTNSLLLPSNLGTQEIDTIDADLMLNTLGDDPIGTGNSMNVIDNGLGNQSIAQNQLFDETSQVSSKIMFHCSLLRFFYFSLLRIFLQTICLALMAKMLKRTKLLLNTIRSTQKSCD